MNDTDPRKIVQIVPLIDDYSEILFALAQDGSVFRCTFSGAENQSWTWGKWSRVPSLPKD
jgi:hypothetical protein